MKRTFLEELGLEKEVIDKIMAEHGKTVNEFKDKADSADGKDKQIELLDKQLKEANKEIKSYKDMNIDDIKENAKTWETKFNEQKNEMEDLKKTTALDIALTKTNAKNGEDLKHFLDLDKLKFKDGEIEGLEEQIKVLQEEKDYLFNPVEDSANGNEPTDERFNFYEPPGSQGDGKSGMAQTIENIFNND